jgi:hypothetical protein
MQPQQAKPRRVSPAESATKVDGYEMGRSLTIAAIVNQ